ncbi:uncharacterized protein L969DRAFT_84358 [Mixia osmundae IAM 14324]|uniref:Vacuolar membrane-associated protein IML1 n=1 Tax=Mixia osmundae (strain CBS 9802 / IAM 14324 / JCM 22182 / KY 12970) TaxID=764103 RepID=G7E330_MIXOS|nr:uncharacterized protein L969DRAFT_84358 [Mixia osmundae IAM 14324]KEI42500.1 hypothetical protein L969DRAFT_84358 [Mixia osmundae IAM 14324]GAA97211.1 hypothetical protein E5Q_03887 [Mixia osmundae IAM 14324]
MAESGGTRLTAWVHESSAKAADVIVSHSALDGPDGTLYRLVKLRDNDDQTEVPHFLFRKSASSPGEVSAQLEISLSSEIAKQLNLLNRDAILVQQLEEPLNEAYLATHVELYFKDQHLGRADMHRLSLALQDTCVWIGQRISIPGCNLRARVGEIWTQGQRTNSAYVTHATKTVFRSESAKFFIFMQLSEEMWHFDNDGCMYYEKAIGLFLPELFTRWEQASTDHVVSLVLSARILYTKEEALQMAKIPTMDPDGRYYLDVYRVVADLESHRAWSSILRTLQAEVFRFKRSVLLDHSPVKDQICGKLSAAHNGNVLESINLAVNAFDKNYIDRDLHRTGLSVVIVTAGTCHFHVDKLLLRITTERMLDHGIGMDCVSLAKMPLHQVPLFRYYSHEPVAKKEADPRTIIGKGIPSEARKTARGRRPLYGLSQSNRDPLYHDATHGSEPLLPFYTVPHWLDCSFYSRQPDKPFRADRFMPRCRMPEIESLGAAEHENSAISIALLPRLAIVTSKDQLKWSEVDNATMRRLARERFDAVACGRMRVSQQSFASTRAFDTGSESQNAFGILDSAHSDSQHSFGIDDEASLSSPSKLPSPVLVSEPPRVATPPAATTPRIPASPLPVAQDSPNQESSAQSEATTRSRVRSSSVSTSRTSLSLRTANGDKPRFTPQLISRIASQAGQAPAQITPEKGANWFWPRKSSAGKSEVAAPQITSITSITGKLGSLRSNNQAQESEPKPATTDISRSHLTLPKPSQPNVLPVSPTKSEQISTVVQPIPLRKTATLNEESDLISRSHRSDIIGSYRSAGVSFEADSLEQKRKSLAVQDQRHRLNPSNPSKSTQVLLRQSQRWINIFPRHVNDQRSVKWKSLCSPASLPLYTTHYPSARELKEAYVEKGYTVPINQHVYSFMVKPAKSMTEAAAGVLKEAIAQRLSQGFQLIVPLAGATSTLGLAMIGSADISQALTDPLRMGARAIYLSMSSHIHRIQYDQALNQLKVTIYVRRQDWLKPDHAYRCVIWPFKDSIFEQTAITFPHPDLSRFDVKLLDRMICGQEAVEEFSDALRYRRIRLVLLPAPIRNRETIISQNSDVLDESSTDEEIRNDGIIKLYDLFRKSAWLRGPSSETARILKVQCVMTTADPSIYARQVASKLDAALPTKTHTDARDKPSLRDCSLAEIASHMLDRSSGLQLVNRTWYIQRFENSFIGKEFIEWLMSRYIDLSTRKDALEAGQRLQEQGLFVHVRGRRKLLDGQYFYYLAPDYAPIRKSRWFSRSNEEQRQSSRPASQSRGQFAKRIVSSAAAAVDREGASAVKMSTSIVIDHDPKKLSDRAETAILHIETSHNPVNGSHLQIHWMCTSRLVDELLQQYRRLVERYGYRLVEEHVHQIKDITQDNPFQKITRIALTVQPPDVPDLGALADSILPDQYFEMQLLRQHGYLLDVEADDRFPRDVEVSYSYRRNHYDFCQFIHTSGIAFVQISRDEDGSSSFLFLRNRIYLSHAPATSDRDAISPDVLCSELRALCNDSARLTEFWRAARQRLLQDIAEAEDEAVATANASISAA